MVVENLLDFISNQTLCKQGAVTVKLEEEIKLFKAANRNIKPVILFDYLGCLEMLVTNNMDTFYAGKQPCYIACARYILKKLTKDFGCELLFYLDNSPTPESKIPYLCKKYDEYYMKQIQIIDLVKNGGRLTRDMQQLPHIGSINHNLSLVIKEYGKLIICTENSISFDIIEFATQNTIFGIFTSNTDYLIMPGECAIYSTKDFDINEFTMKKWRKRSLNYALSLNAKQMVLFSIFVGNDVLPFEVVRPFYERITSNANARNMDRSASFLEVADYIRRKYPRGIIEKDEIEVLGKEIFELHPKMRNRFFKNEKVVTMWIKDCIKFYNCYKPRQKRDPQWLKKHADKTNYSILWCLFLGKAPIPIFQHYIDLRRSGVKSFAELATTIIRRKLRIIFVNDESVRRQIICKRSHNEPFEMRSITAIDPPSDILKLVPNISKMIDESNKPHRSVPLLSRLKVLLWITSGENYQEPALGPKFNHWTKIINTIYFVPVLILNYLVKEKQIKIEDADALLLTIHKASLNIEEKIQNIEYPENFDEHSLWIAQTFAQLIHYFECSLAICGFYEQVLKKDYFDGYTFFDLHPKYLQYEKDQRDALLDPIRNLRLYAE